jgi:hypothetical protein
MISMNWPTPNCEKKMKLILLVSIGLLTMFAAGPSAAEECPAEAKQRARTLYDEGAKHYHLNEFSDAANLFKQSYKACATPRVLYNIGQSYRLQGDNEQALLFYRQYLNTMVPSDPYKDDVTKLIHVLQDEIQQKKQAREAPPTGVAPAAQTPQPATVATAPAASAGARPAPAAAVTTGPALTKHETPVYKRGWFWTVLGAGAVVVAGAVVLGVELKPTSNLGLANFR